MAMPIHITAPFLKMVNSTFFLFLWAHKPPRIKAEKLSLAKDSGGLAFPDIQKYHIAAH